MRKYKNLCSFYCLNNTKIKIAKEDFHQLTQCCDNSLFIKKWHANTQSERLVGKAFIMTKVPKKLEKVIFSYFTAKNLIDPSFISSLLCFDIKDSWHR